MARLYLVEIGGTREDCLFELHSVHAIVAQDDGELLAQCREKFTGLYGAPHIDGWISFDLTPPEPGARLPGMGFFVVELGRNSAEHLRETHHYLFLEAPNGREALQSARAQMPGWHIDTVLDLDRLAQRMGHALDRRNAQGQPQPAFTSRYIRLDRM